MIIDESYLEHHGVKGMHWGVRKGNKIPLSLTRKERKAVNKALTPKAHSERMKRHHNNSRTDEIELVTQKFVAQALANPNSPVKISNVDHDMVVHGRDFAEVVIGRFGNVRLDPFNDNLVRVTKNTPGRR